MRICIQGYMKGYTKGWLKGYMKGCMTGCMNGCMLDLKGLNEVSYDVIYEGIYDRI